VGVGPLKNTILTDARYSRRIGDVPPEQPDRSAHDCCDLRLVIGSEISELLKTWRHGLTANLGTAIGWAPCPPS
jgi:hypothetical protein